MVAAATVLFYFSGCVAVSDQSVVVSGFLDQEIHRQVASCGPGLKRTGSPDEEAAGIDPHAFSVLSWNSHRSNHGQWRSDLISYGSKADLVLLQEAALGLVLDAQSSLSANQWLMGSAFYLDGQEIGVMSAARVPSREYCMTREPEPLIRVPKIGLAAVYPLAGLDVQMLVVNIHLVNFTLDTSAVRHQIEALENIVENHHGPVIVAGDFNTWSDRRKSLVDDKMLKLGLQAVTFSPDNRVDILNHKVDGVFFKGLEVVRSISHEVTSSDHNPLEVHFKVDPELGAAARLVQK